MSRLFQGSFITIWILLTLTVLSQAQAPNTQKLPFLSGSTRYLWPTNASNYMSATFGETRSAHFHAAIDVGTWGQNGYEVYASRDGIVSRIGVSPSGYGNVVYLKHDDGSYSMYAHLRNFAPKIQHIVDSYRLRTFRFNFDQNLEAYQIMVRRGELIAYSGDTGIGPPHLHFELRTPSNNPFNPLLAGIRVADKVPPRIVGVSVEPLSIDATVNGRRSIHTTVTRASGNDVTFGTITATGTIGLGVDASDRADAMRNVYAVYELKLFVENELYFHSKADSFDLSKARMMFLDRVYPILREQRKGYQRLFVRDGNEVAFYQQIGRNGTISLQPGTYNIRIEAADFFGNRTAATGRLRITDPPVSRASNTSTFVPQPVHISQNNGLPPELASLNWTNNWIALRSGSSVELQFREPGSFISKSITQNLNSPSDAFDLTGASILTGKVNTNEVTIHRVIPGTKTLLRTPDQRLSLEFRPNTLYDTLSVAFAWRQHANRYYIETLPTHEPLQVGYVVRFLLPDSVRNQRGLGVYQVSGSGNRETYSFVGGSIVRGAMQFTTATFGTFTFLTDTQGPEMSRPRIYRRADGMWLASVRVSDNRSGVDYTSAEFYINGIRGIPEYDPFGSLLIYYLPDFTPRARANEFLIRLKDRAGNTTEERFTVNR
jgi:hypothetical protein